MKYLSVGAVVLGLLSGCSATDKQSSDERYVLNENVQHEIGQAKSKIGDVKITLNSLGAKEQVVTINVDKLPYQQSFDLCEETGIYQDTTSVTTAPDGTTTPTVKDKKVNCESWFSVQQLDTDRFFVSYELNALKGYEVQDFNGYDVYLPRSEHFSQINTIYFSGDKIEPTKQIVNGALVKSVLVEFNL
ncbi:hypothetical protein VrSk94_10480 [Vibrio rotiferianus]